NNPGAIGKVLEFPDNKRITPADYDGEWAQIQNIPVGEFVFQITENDHAKTLTPSFQVTSNMMQSPQVEVTLTMGAGIIGIVQDDTGKPVANAIVATDMNGGIAADGGFFEIFKPFLPDKHTTTQTKTDGQGHFKINRLAFADYMLRISHPDFCEGSTIDIKLDGDGQMKDIGIVSLARGAVMEGHCLLGNQAAGQVKVQISPPEGSKPELDNEGRVKPFFSASAITDNEGYYRMLKRVPPGSYKIHASRQAGNNDIFTPLLHMKATSREMVITAGQQQSMQNFELPAQ
ncbi:MAG: carboxypeptidase-like regulatory domain-containing protein, partial [Planctomycetota bacterium]